MITLWVDFNTIPEDRIIKLDFSSDRDVYKYEQPAIAMMIEQAEKIAHNSLIKCMYTQATKRVVMAQLNAASKYVFRQTNVHIDVQEVPPKRCTCVCTCGAI